MNVAPRVSGASGTCGPLLIRVVCAEAQLADVLQQHLDLFSVAWRDITRHVYVRVARCSERVIVAGSYLTCGQMRVDRDRDRFTAWTRHGITARGALGQHDDMWVVNVPEDLELDEPQLGNLEDVFSLICTVGWRAEGWSALHAGAVAGPYGCAILCAPSGGGKSTLAAALLASGWTTLGDDKLLLRADGAAPVVRPLLKTLNLDPQTNRWVPIPGIDALPRYSAWTNKRRVDIARISPAGVPDFVSPSHVIQIVRTHGTPGVRATPLPRGDILPALLRQIVIPNDAASAQAILRTVATCARRLKSGIRFEVGDDAYGDGNWLGAFERAFAWTA